VLRFVGWHRIEQTASLIHDHTLPLAATPLPLQSRARAGQPGVAYTTSFVSSVEQRTAGQHANLDLPVKDRHN